MRFALTVLAIALGEILGLYVADALAQEHAVRIVGKLFSEGDRECAFFIDPEGDSISINLSSTPGEYLCEYLKGSETRRFVITLGPSEK